MPPKKGVPAVPPKRNSSKFIREGLTIPGEFTPEQQAARAARVAAEQAAATTAGSSGNTSQPRTASNAAPQPTSSTDERPRQPSESKIPSRLTSSNDVASTTANTPNKFGYKPPPIPKSSVAIADRRGSVPAHKPESKKQPPSIGKPSTAVVDQQVNLPAGKSPASNKPWIPKLTTALGDRPVSVPINKSPASMGPSAPKSALLAAALNKRRNTLLPLTKKASESPISTPLNSAPLQSTHKSGFGYRNSTASSNSHRKSEPSASQEKGGNETPKTTTDSLEKRRSLHEVPSPIEGFLQIDVADHERRTRHGVVLGHHPERELGPRDEDIEDNRSDSSGSSSSFIDSPVDRSKQEVYRHLLASAPAKKPEKELGLKNENKEDGQSTTSRNSSPVVLSPPIGPAPVEALPALPTSFNPLLGPFSDTTPAHTIASPLTSEEGDFDERSLAVDLDEGLYDALGITTPDFQSPTQSEIEECISPNTSTPSTPPPKHESKIASLLTSPRWSLIQKASATPNTQSLTDSEIEEPETRDNSVSPTPELVSEINISSHSAPAGDFATPSYSVENSARERALAQGQRRPGQGHVPLHDLEERRYMPQEIADFESWALDPANAEKPGVKKAVQAMRAMRSKFFLTASELRYYNAVREASTDRAVRNLGELKKKHEDEIKKLQDQLSEVVDAAGLFDGEVDKLTAESAGKLTPLECDNQWKSKSLAISLDIENLKHRLTDAELAKSLLETAHTKEVEELQQKLKVFEASARVNGEEQENIRRELQSVKLEVELGNTASRDQLAATGKERDSLQRQLKDRNQDIETISEERDSAQASEKAATELLNLANQNHTQIANALQGQIDIITGKKNEVEVAFSDLQNKLSGLTQAHAENQSIIKDLKVKQEQIDKNDKTLSEGECNARNVAENELLHHEIDYLKLSLELQVGRLEHFESENTRLNTAIKYIEEHTPEMITHRECDNKYSGSIVENEKLKADIETLKVWGENAHEDVLRLEGQIAGLRAQLEEKEKALTEEITARAAESLKLNDTITELHAQLAEKEKSRRSSVAELTVAEKDFKDSVGERTAESLLNKKTISGLRKELAEKEKAFNDLVTERIADSSYFSKIIAELRDQLTKKEKARKSSVVEQAAESSLLDQTIAGLRTQLAEKERELQDSITKATAESHELNETIAENSRTYGEEKAQLAGELSEAIARKEASDREIDSLESKIRSQLAEKEKELQDSIAEATELNTIIAENSRAYDEEKDILAGELAEAVEKKEDSDKALASLENKIGGTSGFGQNPFDLESTELKQKIVDLQREIEALAAKENRKSRITAREGKRDKDFHTRASFGLAIMDVELHLAAMRITRAFNGITRDDHEPAITAAQKAVTISEQLRDEALMAQSSFWLAVVQWYAGNTEDAGQLLGFIEQTLLPRRERQYAKEYIQTCEDALDCPMEAAGYAKGLERSRSGSISSDDSQAEGRHRR